jgi:hypothetical protein
MLTTNNWASVDLIRFMDARGENQTTGKSTAAHSPLRMRFFDTTTAD